MSRVERTDQQEFYESRNHNHLRPRDEDHYAEHLVEALARGIDLADEDRVVELGAGFGRFTFPLLRHCASVVAVDLTQRVLDDLETAKRKREIPDARCQTLNRDVDAISIADLPGAVDCAVGFFFLHHLPDFAGSIARLRGLLPAGGRIAFVEPNRRNPLFVAQVIGCRDMTWRGEKGMFLLSAKKVENAYRAAGFVDVETQRFGFFPPQIINRFESARALERRLERSVLLDPVLPFLLCTARNPGE